LNFGNERWRSGRQKGGFMRKLRIAVVAALFAVGLAACGGGDSPAPENALAGKATCAAVADSGMLCIKAVAADGITPIVGAEVQAGEAAANEAVKLASKGVENPDKCVTDNEGNAACVVPSRLIGTQTYSLIFSGFANKTFSATTTLGEVTDAGTQSMSGDTSARWLVVPGGFDGIQLLLSEIKGCTLTGDPTDPPSLTASDECEAVGLTVLSGAEVTDTLSNPEALAQYQAVFMNCGSNTASGDEITALKGFVDAGGNMYFSDLADDSLTAIFPDLVTFPPDKNNTGSGTLPAATIVDAGLQAFIGADTMEIEFDWGSWTALGEFDDMTGQDIKSGLPATWTVFVQADVSSLAATLTGTRPVTVGGPQEDGCIFYTSYHVEAGGAGTNQEKALRYLVLNRMSNCS